MDDLATQVPILIKSMLWVGAVFTYGVLRKYKKFEFHVLGLVLAAIFTTFLAALPSLMSLFASLALLYTAPQEMTLWLTDTFGLFSPHINAFWACVSYLGGLLMGKYLNLWFSFQWSKSAEPLAAMISLHLLVEFVPKIFLVSDTLVGILLFLTFPLWGFLVVVLACLAAGYNPKFYRRGYSRYGYYHEWADDEDWDDGAWYFEEID